MKKETVLKILYITFALSLIVVWGQSCLNQEESTVNSDMVLDMVTSVDEMKNGSSDQVHMYDNYTRIVRKIAHVVEYSAVGFQLMGILLLRGKKKLKHYLMCLYGGLTVAFIDESIQILSSRGPLISDVWIDLGGITLGMIFATLVSIIVIKIHSKKNISKIEEC